MAIELNQKAYKHAVSLIQNGLEVEHDAKNWNAVKPTEDEIIRYLNTHDLDAYGRWFLGIDTAADPKDKSKYLYPTGDLKIIHKSALTLSAADATKQRHEEIASAARALLDMIESN